jgi:hypothetical protein
MKSERIELAALASVAGPQRTAQEIETAAYLADFAAGCRKIAETPQDERIERSQAVLSLCVRAKDAEAVRAAYWLRAPLGARMVAVMSAGLPKARASDALKTFNALERGQVWVALAKLVADLGMIQKCMNGGNSAPPNEARTGEKSPVMNGGLH